MSKPNLSINRDDWQRLREFKKTPFKKRYFEIIESGFTLPNFKEIKK
jgi:hypothetical protein